MRNYMKWLIAAIMLFAVPAYSANTPSPPADIWHAITAQPVWLNTSRPLTAEDLQGRIILLDFWTLGCINCMDIIPDLKALEEKFGPDITVIGIHSAKFANEKDTENIRNAVLRYELAHPVVNDANFLIWNTFGVHAWPTLVLISPTGEVASTYAGEGNKAALENDIRTLEARYKGNIVTTPLPIQLESYKQPQTLLRFPGKVSRYTGNNNSLLVSDSGNNRLLLIGSEDNKIITQIGSGTQGFKDGTFETAQFNHPEGTASLQNKSGSLIYIADTNNHALRVADMTARTVTTIAGTGSQGQFLNDKHDINALKTPLSSPWDITFYPDDNHLAIAMTGAHQLWSYDVPHHTLSLLAGNGEESMDDGIYPHNSLAQPSGLFAQDGKLYFTDAESSALRVLTGDGNVTTLIGKGLFDFGYKEGGRADALLQHCSAVTGNSDNLYVADTYNHSIRRFELKSQTLYNYAGHDVRGSQDSTLASASFNEPTGITLVGDTLYVADTNNHRLRAIDMKTAMVRTLGEVPAAATPASSDSTGPNLATLTFAVAAHKPIDVNLDLKPGWHINDTAPSQLSFKGNNKAPLMSFSRDLLMSGHIQLPKLAAKRSYHLEGTLYFCEDKAGSLCMIKSFDVTLTTKGKHKTVTLPVY